MTNFFTAKNPGAGPSKMDEEGDDHDYQSHGATKPWIEKYRPKKLTDIVFQDEAVSAFNGILKTGETPHLLLYGPPGTGKTSIILALAKELYGEDFYRSRVLELNASDDRGINQVREKIKKYASQVSTRNPNKDFKCPPYKLIILDEADHMTQDAQHALRRIIEDFSKQTRFCIICNYITKIIEPLASRCVKFRFKEIPQERQYKKLEDICSTEGISYNKESLTALIDVCEGDLRKSTNLLQTVSKVYKKIESTELVNDIAGVVPKRTVTSIMSKVMTSDIDNVIKDIEAVINEGYSGAQVLNTYFKEILENEKISRIAKSQILEKIADVERGLLEGGRDDLQLFDLFATSKVIIALNPK